MNIENIDKMVKSRNFNTNTKNDQVWLTPRWILQDLGSFDLDPCSLPDNERPWDTACNHYSIFDGQCGLGLPWEGRVWCNPPYGQETFKWIEKLSKHKDGGIALIFARTETKGFHRWIWQEAMSVYFFCRRIRFCDRFGIEAGSANAPSCMISYTEKDTQVLLDFEGKHGGKTVFL